MRLCSHHIPPAKSTPRSSKVIPQELFCEPKAAEWLRDTYSGSRGGWTLVHAGSTETNAPNLTVVAQAESLRHSCLFKPLKMTPTTFTMFCFLPSLHPFPSDAGLTERVEDLIGTYGEYVIPA
jgi:hypothetical protein